tara:strand:- start:2002 stop:3435 length:1434 start_codon:yes stop_codon:yes gene_type:complete
MSKVVSIILSGGSGSRLWPVSRKLSPKPFMKIAGIPLLQHALKRADAFSDEIVVITNSNYFSPSKEIEQASQLNTGVYYLLEPIGRNTAPAIALALRYVSEKYDNTVTCLVMAADHIITGQDHFHKSIEIAVACAETNPLVLFGVHPTRPETGYGYIRAEKAGQNLSRVDGFTEKPDLVSAERYLLDDCYYWNAGIFCFVVQKMVDNFSKLSPNIWETSLLVHNKRLEEGATTSYEKKIFEKFENLSFDYAVAEKMSGTVVVAARFGWSDVGTWGSVADTYTSDPSGNSSTGVSGDHLHLIDTANTHVHSVNINDKIIAAIGVKDLVVADTPDALLITSRHHDQKVRELVESLIENDLSPYVDEAWEVKRPWGSFYSLIVGKKFQIKLIKVQVGGELSLQFHRHRSEHWVVTSGSALIQINDKKFVANEGEHCFIAVGDKHRLSNYAQSELMLVEVQIGDYLGEDDIVRLEDSYGRV